MVAANFRDQRSSIANDLLVLAVFLLSGLVSGLLFACLTTRPSLETFWFIRGDKFLIPRYTCWIAFSLILLAGFSAGYSVSSFGRWLQNSIGTRGHRLAAGSI